MPAILSRQEEAQALRLAHAQPESAAELGQLAEKLKQRAVDIALEDGKVRGRLKKGRNRVLAVDYREEKDEQGRLIRLGDVCIYDYDQNILVVASVDSRTGRVIEIRERPGAAPPITDEEREEAIRIALDADPKAKAMRSAAAGTVAFPSPSYAFDAEPDRKGHRGCTLFFRAGRGGRDVEAITVDLSSGEVVPQERLPEILRSRPAPAADQRQGASNAG